MIEVREEEPEIVAGGVDNDNNKAVNEALADLFIEEEDYEVSMVGKKP